MKDADIRKYHIVSGFDLEPSTYDSFPHHADDHKQLISDAKVATAADGETRYILQYIAIVKAEKAAYDVKVEEKV